jgi:hypothetical protein
MHTGAASHAAACGHILGSQELGSGSGEESGPLGGFVGGRLGEGEGTGSKLGLVPGLGDDGLPVLSFGGVIGGGSPCIGGGCSVLLPPAGEGLGGGAGGRLGRAGITGTWKKRAAAATAH